MTCSSWTTDALALALVRSFSWICSDVRGRMYGAPRLAKLAQNAHPAKNATAGTTRRCAATLTAPRMQAAAFPQREMLEPNRRALRRIKHGPSERIARQHVSCKTAQCYDNRSSMLFCLVARSALLCSTNAMISRQSHHRGNPDSGRAVTLGVGSNLFDTLPGRGPPTHTALTHDSKSARE